MAVKETNKCAAQPHKPKRLKPTQGPIIWKIIREGEGKGKTKVKKDTTWEDSVLLVETGSRDVRASTQSPV